MIVLLTREKAPNINGASITVFQKLIGFLDYLINRSKIISLLLFSKPLKESNPLNIEKLVWYRLGIVSVLSIIYEFVKLHFEPKSISICLTFISIYVFLLQITLLISLLKPLFGVQRVKNSLELEEEKSNKKIILIPTPKRSLLLALVNLFEIIISWGIIYRTLMPCQIDNLNEANYFSLVTLTTLGYGDINAGNNELAQTAVSINLIIFVIFSVCHITTILGSITNKETENESIK
ncbi:ion channel [Fluviicola sp.]|uniref:ion channel n=1 Tax=Fluviicola sp. TaxID=1917219 RepID=UPI00260DEF28|nr:ion channel [Fluviicola sp.]